MNDPEPSDQQKHWQELAEQLGLPAEADESRAPDFASAPRMPSQGPSELATGGGTVSGGDLAVDDQDQLSRNASETMPEEDVGSMETRKVAPTREERKPQERKPASVPRGEGRGQGRERSGRGRRESSAPSLSTDEEAPEEAAPNTGELGRRGAGEKKRGARGRGRGTIGNTDERTAGAALEQPRSPTMSISEADEKDEVDNLTDWNVPSWNELIESLYRPER